MYLLIEKIDNKFIAKIFDINPHEFSTAQLVWITAKPMKEDNLLNALFLIKYNEREIYDALSLSKGKSANIPHLLFEKRRKKNK